jgi:hypothetical protein
VRDQEIWPRASLVGAGLIPLLGRGVAASARIIRLPAGVAGIGVVCVRADPVITNVIKISAVTVFRLIMFLSKHKVYGFSEHKVHCFSERKLSGSCEVLMKRRGR